VQTTFYLETIRRGFSMQGWFDNFRDLADLSAQLEMAYWAKWMTIATVVSILVSCAALVGLLASLKQTNRGLVQAKLTGALERRAWVTISEVTLLSAMPERANLRNYVRFKLRLCLQNNGLLPATSLTINARLNVNRSNGALSKPGEQQSVLPPRSLSYHDVTILFPLEEASTALHATIKVDVKYNGSELGEVCITEMIAPITFRSNKSLHIRINEMLPNLQDLGTGDIAHTKMT
jgi:hypothetical protein